MTEKDFIEATARLEAAIQKFKAAKTAVEVARELLKKKITKAEELVQKAEKVESAVQALKSTLEQAKVVLGDQNLSEIQLHYAAMVLQSAIFNYLSAANRNK